MQSYFVRRHKSVGLDAQQCADLWTSETEPRAIHKHLAQSLSPMARHLHDLRTPREETLSREALVASPCLHGLSFHQFAQLGRHAAAFVRCLALLVVKQPHRGVFVVPDRLRPFENAPREVEKEQR